MSHGPLGSRGNLSAVAITDELLDNNSEFARTFQAGELGAEPAKKVAVVACMDARIDLHAILGLGLGDAHVIRNAGGVVTDDVLRSLVLSQHLLGTEEIVVIQHTSCGLHELVDEEVSAEIAKERGTEPHFALLGFDDLEASVRTSIARLSGEPLLSHRSVRGFVYDVTTGRLSEVQPA